MTDRELEQRVLSDVGLRRWWRSDGACVSRFVRENRARLIELIERARDPREVQS